MNHNRKGGSAGRNRIANIALLVLCQSFQALAIGGVALFLPVIRGDLQINFTQGGAMAAANTMAYAFMQIPAGFLADRFGAKRVFVIGTLGTAAFSFLFGMVTQYWQAVAVQSLIGLFRALLFAPGMSLIAGWFPPERRATAMGLYLIGGFSGNLLLDILGPWLVAEFDWHIPFLTFSSAGIIASLVLWRFGQNPPGASQGQKMNVGEVLQLFRLKLMWVCGAIQYIRLSIMQGIAFWLPSLLVDEKGLSLQIAGLIVALRAAIIAPSNIIGGYASDRLKNPTLVIAISLVVLAVTASLIAVQGNIVVLVILIAINAIFVQMYFGPLFSVPTEILGKRTIGISTGFSNLFANVGSFTTTYLLGVLRDHTGSFRSGFFAIAAACVVGLAFTFVLARMRRAALAQVPRQT